VADTSSIYGYILDESSANIINWGFPKYVPIGIRGVYEILPNNTLLVSQIETNNS
jgi:hypothetical protein